MYSPIFILVVSPQFAIWAKIMLISNSEIHLVHYWIHYITIDMNKNISS